MPRAGGLTAILVAIARLHPVASEALDDWNDDDGVPSGE